MIFQSSTGRGALAAYAEERRGEHRGIKTIGRLVLLCAGGLILAALLLVMTALQVVQSLDRADLATERQRAANAVDVMTAMDGPLTAERAVILGRIAGLADARLTHELTSTSRTEQIPLLAGQGPSGSYLTWSRSDMAEQVFRQFAPIRLPIIGGMLLLVLGIMLKLRQVVADIERQRRLAFLQSRTDVMTGLANRLAFETSLGNLVAEAAPFALVLFDLDRFKEINDRHGHAAGDDVLRAVGTRLSRLLQDGDMLARLGGDEFVLLVAGQPDRAALTSLAGRCIATIEQPIELEGGTVRVGVSLGIVPSDALGLPAATLMGAADAALYRAKSARGGSFRFAGDDEPSQPFGFQHMLVPA